MRPNARTSHARAFTAHIRAREPCDASSSRRMHQSAGRRQPQSSLRRPRVTSWSDDAWTTEPRASASDDAEPSTSPRGDDETALASVSGAGATRSGSFPSLLAFPSFFALPSGAKTRWDSKPAPLRDLAVERVPAHVAIIMDGNARWAARRRLPRSIGHERGVTALRGVVRCCAAWNVKTLTVFAFSQENWGRNQAEVNELMALVETALREELPLLVKEGVRVEVIGDLSKVSDGVRIAVDRAVEATRGNSTLRLVIALSYGGRQDIVLAARALAVKVAKGEMRAEDIDEDSLSEHLSTYNARAAAEDPLHFTQAPDLLIRTSGEMRLSNFLLWDLAYTELYFAQMMWPEFGEAELRRAFHAYAKRDRRFGGR